MNINKQSLFPFFVLAIIILYTYSLFAMNPYLGFYYSYLDEVTDVFVDEAIPLQGGRIVRVDGEDFTELKSNLFKPLFAGLNPGDTVQIVLEKEGQTLNVDWTLPTDNQAEVTARLQSTWWLPFVFWIAGVITWFNIRPRNTVWRLLVMFNMTIALYLSALNGPSLGNRLFSVPLIGFVGCMIMPIFLHLHWKFPYPLAKLPRRFIEVFYGLVFLISLLTIFRVLPSQTSILLSVIAVFGSTIILIVKIVVQKDHKVDNKFILFAFLLIFIPPLVTTIAYTYADVTLDYFGFTGAYMAMPALPSAYFIVAFQNTVYGKRTRIIIRRLYVFLVLVCSLSISGLLFYIGDQNILLGMSSIIFFMAAVAILSLSIVVIPMMGVMAYNERMDSRQRYLSTGLEPRSNRLITPYLFLVIAGGVFGAAVVFVAIKFDLPSRDYEIVAITGLTTIGLTLGLYPVFRSWMDQRVYGIRYSPDGLRDSFSRRIVSMLSIQDLTHLIEDEILPSMMIRKSALYYLREQGAFELLSSYGVENDEPVDIKKLIPHIPGTKTSLIYRSAIADYCPEWVQIVFRLSIKGKLIGVWLLGRKDPDDEYLFSDLVTLQTLSSQISVALSNILTTIQLHNHYQANIDRDEADRVEIARGLHDEVLNRLASLAMLINQDADKKQLLASYEETKLNLRLIIRRLRPAVLDFGLGHAIHDMASELMDANENLRINVNLPYQSPSFDESVETHIFRIVQHACENAALHSQAHEVHVSGVLKPDRININVKDEGVGFKYDEMDNATLIEDGHFGLVGIQERTDLIHATLIVNTDEGRGTEIQVHWEEVNYD